MEVKKLDGSYMHVEEVNGMLCEVEKKELIGGVFEDGEEAWTIRQNGAVGPKYIYAHYEYAIRQGLVWKTREEALRKVEIDNLIAKHRITSREVLENQCQYKYNISVNLHNLKLQTGCSYIYINGMAFTEAGAKEICEKVSKNEWLKFVELAR